MKQPPASARDNTGTVELASEDVMLPIARVELVIEQAMLARESVGLIIEQVMLPIARVELVIEQAMLVPESVESCTESLGRRSERVSFGAKVRML